MVKYCMFDKCIITVDDDDIILNITNIIQTKYYKRIGSEKNTYICGLKLPPYFCDNKYESIDVLKKVKGLYDYTKDKCGLYTTYYYNGKIKEEYFINDGLKEGIYKKYNDNGYLKNDNGYLEIECNYVNNILHGPYKKYHKSGNIEIECNYNEGKINGLYKENKIINDNKIHEYSEYNYVDNIKNGKFIVENKTNNTITNGIYVDNVITESIQKNITTNIILLKRNINQDNPQLINIEKYYESGKIKEKYTMTKNELYDGDYIYYYENGNIKSIMYYKCGSKIFNSVSYYEDGSLMENREDTEHIENNNKIRTIITKKYYNTGKLERYEKNTGINGNHRHKESYGKNGILKYYSLRENNDIIEFSTNEYINKEKIKEFALKLLDSIKD